MRGFSKNFYKNGYEANFKDVLGHLDICKSLKKQDFDVLKQFCTDFVCKYQYHGNKLLSLFDAIVFYIDILFEKLKRTQYGEANPIGEFGYHDVKKWFDEFRANNFECKSIVAVINKTVISEDGYLLLKGTKVKVLHQVASQDDEPKVLVYVEDFIGNEKPHEDYRDKDFDGIVKSNQFTIISAYSLDLDDICKYKP